MRFATPHNIQRLFQVALVVCLAVITWFALTSDPPMPGAFAISDKLNHIVAFAVLAFLSDNAFPRKSPWHYLIALPAYGMSLELLQYQTGYRHFEFADIAADIFGVLMYLPLHGQLVRQLRYRLNSSQIGQ